ncbi:Cytochrome P450 monooxygenase AKT7-like protein [Cladobotryum mycophilum]|uniref:Cytochrome P450 monooxygenase AKT7-like protein n=1 Tax=Cladobotryum mycophilum TaxID=491253 RepID=A0ABR0SC44_9HYPO
MSFLDVLLLAATYAACIIIPLSILFGSYNLFFHPLRRYPGPLVGRLTEAYGGYFAWKKNYHLATYQNFLEYGPVFRQSPNRLMFNSMTAVFDIYLNPRVTKGQSYANSQLTAKYPSLINAIDSKQHRRKRKIIAPVITERSMKKFEPTMSEHVNVFLQQLLASCESGGAIDMTERFQRLGIDVVGQLAFGYPFNTQTDETHRFVPEVINAMSRRIYTYMQLPSITPYYVEKLCLLFNIRTLIKFEKTIRTMIKTRMSQDKDAHHDLYSFVAGHIGKEQDAFLPGEMWPEAFFFIIAGGVTTATTMSAMFFYLTRNPKSYAALAREIRSTFNSASEIHSGPQLAGCKYLRACIDETLRMSPPTVGTLWRQQEKSDDEPLIVDGHVIPRGTQVGVSLYSLMHNEEYFPDSFTYTPERWLEPPEGTVETEEEKAKRATMRKVFVPFLVGDRACAGKAMAYMEASLTMARTMWFFDFEGAPGKPGELGAGELGRTDGRGRPGEFQLDDLFVTAHQGPNLIFKPRGDYWKELQTVD